MVMTGRVKLLKVKPFVIAVAADPFSQPSHDAKIAVKMMPETYSGVAVEAIDATERLRSSLDPSRMPASTPISSATGTSTINTQNIRMPVALRASGSRCATGVRKAVEQPKSPSSTPEMRASAGSAQNLKRGTVCPVAGSMTGLFRPDADPAAEAHEEVVAIAVALQPVLEVLVAGPL